ncbi:MAG: hypothetical protein ACK4M7_02615, partial [Burkholderiales bacterium]
MQKANLNTSIVMPTTLSSTEDFNTQFINILKKEGIAEAFELLALTLNKSSENKSKRLNSLVKYLNNAHNELGRAILEECKLRLNKMLGKWTKDREYFFKSDPDAEKRLKCLIYSCKALDVKDPISVDSFRQQLSKCPLPIFKQALQYLKSNSAVTEEQLAIIQDIGLEVTNRLTNTKDLIPATELNTNKAEVNLESKNVKFKKFLKAIASKGYTLLSSGKGGKGSHINKFRHVEDKNLFLNVQVDKEGNAKNYQLQQFKNQLAIINSTGLDYLQQENSLEVSMNAWKVIPATKAITASHSVQEKVQTHAYNKNLALTTHTLQANFSAEKLETSSAPLEENEKIKVQ